MSTNRACAEFNTWHPYEFRVIAFVSSPAALRISRTTGSRIGLFPYPYRSVGRLSAFHWAAIFSALACAAALASASLESDQCQTANPPDCPRAQYFGKFIASILHYYNP